MKYPTNKENFKKYVNIHNWLKRNYGKADLCESKDCKKISYKFDWALKREHELDFRRNYFMKLCRSCHAKYDVTQDTILKLKSKKLSEETKRKLSLINSGKNHPQWGTKISEYHRRRIIESNKTRGVSLETKMKISRSQRIRLAKSKLPNEVEDYA